MLGLYKKMKGTTNILNAMVIHKGKMLPRKCGGFHLLAYPFVVKSK